jgi:ABC-type dipeptide/oligopeptide/nickel transport system permease component
VLVLVGVTFVIHTVMSLVPGDPTAILLGDAATPEQRAALRRELGLDRPFLVRYAVYVAGVARGDLGRSYRNSRPVLDDIREAFPATLRLSLAAVVLTVALGLPAGVLSAVRRNTPGDRVLSIASLLGLSMPVFLVGLLLIYYLAYRWPVFPVGGMDDGPWSYVLPAVTLALTSVATVSRMTRAGMLDVLNEDFVRTARAKGLAEAVVVNKHALKAALAPVVTVLALQVGLLMGGAVLTETVFSWPGIGRLMVAGIRTRDLYLVQGCVLVMAVSFVLINLLTDLSYVVLDPRIRYERRG